MSAIRHGAPYCAADWRRHQHAVCAVAGGMRGAATRTMTKPALPVIGFKSVPAVATDTLVVPEGYVASVIAAWGEAVGVPGNMPAFRPDASNSAAEQAAQMGMHHDGIHFYALGGGSTRGLLAMNHEYTDDGLLHTDGLKTWTAEKVRKCQNAHGLSVIEVELKGSTWQMVRPSNYARRFTMATPFDVGGPAAGHAMMKTAADPAGRTVLGTLNNCASGKTPWGTYLSGEENWIGYFGGGDSIDAHQRRWGMRKSSFYRWRNTTSASMRQRTRTSRTASAGWSRWTRSTRRARRSSAPRSAALRMKGPGSALQGRPRRGVFGRGCALRVHLQVHQPRQDRARRRQGQPHAA